MSVDLFSPNSLILRSSMEMSSCYVFVGGVTMR